MSIQTGYNATNFSALQNDARTKIASKIIEVAKYQLRFYDICDYKETIGSGNSKTVRFINYPHLNLPNTQITEGIDPVGQTYSNTYVEAVTEQWGDIVAITDVAELTLAHPVMAIVQERMGVQAARVIDREIQAVLKTSTAVKYGNAKTTRPSLSTSDVAKVTDVKAIVAKLKMNGADFHDGQNYVAVVTPAVERDLITYDNFILAQAYAGNGMPLFQGEIGKWVGCRWISSNFMPIYRNNTTAAIAQAAHADSATEGSLTDSTAYYFEIVGRNIITDFEEVIFAEVTHTTDVGKTAIDITMPTDVNYVYDLYFGSSSGDCRLVSSRNAASAVVIQKTVPTGTAVAPTIPANDVYVHTTYFLGKGAFAIADLQNLQFFITKDESTVGNVLRLARYVGWKAMFKAAILENKFMFRLESHSSNV